MRALEAIRRANRPGPPEHSIRLRAACFFTVAAAIAACASMGEMSETTAFGAIGLVALGMVFSYVTRNHPPGWVKIVVAAGIEKPQQSGGLQPLEAVVENLNVRVQ